MGRVLRPGLARRTMRKRPAHWFGTALAVMVVAQATSYLVWKELGGEEVVIRPVEVSDATSPERAEAPNSLASSLSREGHASSMDARPQGTAPRVSPATVMNGTTVAVTVVLVVNGAAYLAVRGLLRQRRPQDHAGVEEPAEDAHTEHGPSPSRESPTAEPAERSSAAADVDREARAAGPQGRATVRAAVPQGRTAVRAAVPHGRGAPRAAIPLGSGPAHEPPPLDELRAESSVLFDAGEATRVPHTALVHLEWHDHEMWVSTSHVSARDVTCQIPGRDQTPLPARNTTVQVTMQLDGRWTSLSTRLLRHRRVAGGREVVLALAEVDQGARAALLHLTRREVAL